MFRKPWYLMETEYFCTMSMGVAFFPDDGTEVDDIIKTADIAMYEAKKAGKNQYSIYDNTSSENVSKRLDIENNMRQAVASEIQEFLVYYQPVVDAVTKNAHPVKHWCDGTANLSDLWDRATLYRLQNTLD